MGGSFVAQAGSIQHLVTALKATGPQQHEPNVMTVCKQEKQHSQALRLHSAIYTSN